MFLFHLIQTAKRCVQTVSEQTFASILIEERISLLTISVENRVQQLRFFKRKLF